jgi:hypothetical protein
VSEEERDIQIEIRAIQAVHDALAPLDAPGRARVLAYVSDALRLELPAGAQQRPRVTVPSVPMPDLESREPATPGRLTDIRSLMETKQPRSAIDMAALVAYYLSEILEGDERRESLETADLEKYFKQAGFKLPGSMRNVLGNAAAAGYFDLVGRGRYKLNPVGWNLVVHNLPADGTAKQPARSTRARSAKKATKKRTKNGTAGAKRGKGTGRSG